MPNLGSDPRGVLHVTVMRSQLGRVRGLGAARSGVHVWWNERISSLALVPLTVWFVISVIRLLGQPRAAVAAWAAHPVNAVLLVALVLTTFWHTVLGLQVIIEDYVHDEAAKSLSLLAMKAAVALVGLGSLLAALRMALLPLAAGVS